MMKDYSDTKPSDFSLEQRQQELKSQSRTVISELKERLDRNFEKNSQRKKTRTDELIEQYRTDQKALHNREESTIKERFQQKLEIEKERMVQMNNQLLEESGDID